jgi:hypothetical protein
MGTKTKALKTLINKLEFNPVPLGGNSIYTTKIGIVLGGMVMIMMMFYAVGLFTVIQDKPNVFSNTFLYKNEPYELSLTSWNLRLNIYENKTICYAKQYVLVRFKYHSLEFINLYQYVKYYVTCHKRTKK